MANEHDNERAMAIRIKDIDRKDDDQILATMGGDLVEEYVYSFKDGRGREQKGLSWAGVRELAQLRGNISLGQPKVEDADDHIRVMVEATDLERNVTIWGGTHQPKMIKPREGAPYPDDFAFEKAISKAQRNAIKNLMPQTVVKEIIGRLTSGGYRPSNAKPGSAHVVDKSRDRTFQHKGQLFTAANTDLGIPQRDALSIWGIDSLEDVPTSPEDLQGMWRTLVDAEEAMAKKS